MIEQDGFVTADVPYDDFRRGLPFGKYRVVVNPERARAYLQARLLMKVVLLPVIGLGIGMALLGWFWVALPLVLLGVLAPRLLRRKAPELLLYLSLRDPDVYRDALRGEILEVRAPASAANDS